MVSTQGKSIPCQYITLRLIIFGASIDYNVAKTVGALSLGIKINIRKGGVDPLGRILNRTETAEGSKIITCQSIVVDDKTGR